MGAEVQRHVTGLQHQLQHDQLQHDQLQHDLLQHDQLQHDQLQHDQLQQDQQHRPTLQTQLSSSSSSSKVDVETQLSEAREKIQCMEIYMDSLQAQKQQVIEESSAEISRLKAELDTAGSVDSDHVTQLEGEIRLLVEERDKLLRQGSQHAQRIREIEENNSTLTEQTLQE